MDFATNDEITYAHDTLIKGYPDFDDEKQSSGLTKVRI